MAVHVYMYYVDHAKRVSPSVSTVYKHQVVLSYECNNAGSYEGFPHLCKLRHRHMISGDLTERRKYRIYEYSSIQQSALGRTLQSQGRKAILVQTPLAPLPFTSAPPPRLVSCR